MTLPDILQRLTACLPADPEHDGPIGVEAGDLRALLEHHATACDDPARVAEVRSLIPPAGCFCASFWTVRQQHKSDCPCWPAVGQMVHHEVLGECTVRERSQFGTDAVLVSAADDYQWVTLAGLHPSAAPDTEGAAQP